MSSRASRTLYVGNLPGDIREREVEDLFYKVISSVCNWIGYMHVDIYTRVMLMSKSQYPQQNFCWLSSNIRYMAY